MKALGAPGTFAAWMAALFYFVAGLDCLGMGLGWWQGTLLGLSVVVGAGALSAIGLIAPLSARAGSGSRVLFATRVLALFGLAVEIAVAGLVLSWALRGTLGSSVDEFPLGWSQAALGVWLLALNWVALASRVWPLSTSVVGLVAGATACLQPLTFAGSAGGHLGLPILVCVAAGWLALPAWFLLQASHAGEARGALRIALVTAVPAAALIGVGQLWARHRFSAYEATWTRDLAAERGRIAALRMPVLRGEPLDENAAARYLPLIASLGGSPQDATRRDPELDKLTGQLSKAAAGAPLEPLPEPLRQLLEHRRGLVVTLREATRCTRVDWAFQYERGVRAPLYSLLAARWLASLLVLEGHERAQAGDLQGAAERYLDGARFGADLATQGVLIHGLIGVGVEGLGLRALGDLLTSSDPANLPLAQIADELARLEPAQASLVPGYRGERLTVVRSLKEENVPLPADRGDALADLLFGRALAAYSVGGIDPWLRTAEAALEEPDAAKAEALTKRLEAAILASRNPLTRMLLPSLLRAPISGVDARARFDLVRSAVAAEQARLRDKRYPATLANASVDPWASPATLHYRLEGGGAGYVLWSVGANRQDDAGRGDWWDTGRGAGAPCEVGPSEGAPSGGRDEWPHGPGHER